MKKKSVEELAKIVERHGKWLRNEDGGKRANLREENLSGAELSWSDLRRADLRGADLTGADLRQARLDGATLAGALFVTPAQLRSARGSASTVLPFGLARPSHWVDAS